MTEIYDRNILEALQEGVTNAVAASNTPSLPVAYIDRTFTVPDDQKYLEIVNIPNNPLDRYWGDSKRYVGILRLILHWPIDDRGPYGAMDVIASIAGYFDKGKALQNVKIYETPETTASIKGEADKLFPCSIRYECFRP